MTESGVPMERSVPVFDLGDAGMYGWQVEPDAEGSMWLRVLDGRGSICLPPGTGIRHTSGGNVTGSPTVRVTDLEPSVDLDGHAWLSEGMEVTDTSATPTPNVHAIILAPGGFLWWEDGKLLNRGIEFASILRPGPAESGEPAG